ncbi:MAG TPA: hypothetical protein VGK89_02600 [Candidatus Eisenbacteria bacterium]|jgi:hypothetical protein
MRSDAASGILLIAGSAAGLFVMSHHPTAHQLLDREHLAHTARLNAHIHGIAIAAVPAVFLGLLGLARRLGPSHLTTAALVVYGLGSIALISAAVASGFVATPVAERTLAAEGSAREIYHGLLWYTGRLNQGFAQVAVVASSVAILLWSGAIFAGGSISRAAGAGGALVGAGVLVAFYSGLLPLDVHGFGIVTLAQSAWQIWVGALLMRSQAAPGPA